MCPAGMALNSRHKGTNAPSFRSAVVDEERLGPGYWLRSVLCGPFGASTLLVG